MFIRKEARLLHGRFVPIVFGAFVAAAGFAPAAHAITARDPISYIIDQLNPLLPDFKTPKGFRVKVGGVAGFTPSFEGSSDYHLRFAPTLDIIYRDRVFLNSTRLRINFLPSGNVRGGFQLKYRAGRNERVSEDLTGLGNVGSSWEAGAYIEARLHSTLISADITHDIGGGHQSTLATLLIGQGLYMDDNTLIGAGVNVHWAGRNYMNAFFGITPAQSAASGLPIFTAGSGFKDVGLLLYWRQSFGEHLVLMTNITLKHMLDAANDSPLVQQRGDPKQLISSVAFRYEF